MSFTAKGKKAYTKSKTNKHLTLPYKNYLQKRGLPPQGRGRDKYRVFYGPYVSHPDSKGLKKGHEPSTSS